MLGGFDSFGVDTPNYWNIIEREVNDSLKSIRLVFELGFPEDLVESAQSVVRESAKQGRLIRDDRVRYPSCWLLTAASLALNYDGVELWSRPEFEIFGLSPERIGPLTRAVIEACGLETFEESIRAEGGLINVTPLLMHAGIPGANVPALVGLIDSALRRHVHGAEEQIALWSQSRNGFRDLWKGPERLLRLGGSIACDLLDQINDALLSDEPSDSDLPSHLVEAISNLEQSTRRKVSSRGGVKLPRPTVELDPWSGDGPVIWIPGVNPGTLDEWRVTGSQVERIARYSDPISVPIEPQRSFTISAVQEGNVVQESSISLFSKVPALVFDSATSRLAPQVAGAITIRGDSMLVLSQTSVTIDTSNLTDDEFPALVGHWSGWRVSRVTCTRGDTIEFCVAGLDGVEVRERVRISSAPRAPELNPEHEVSGVRIHPTGGRVFAEPPKLDIHVPERVLTQMRVNLEIAGEEFSLPVSSTEQINDLLADRIPAGEVVALSIDGPIGTRMRRTELVVLPRLKIEQSPDFALLDEDVIVQVVSDSGSAIATIESNQRAAKINIGSISLEVDAVRVSWALHGVDVVFAGGSNHLYSLTVEDLRPEKAGVIRLATDRATPVEFALKVEGDVKQSFKTEGLSVYSVVDLARFFDTARSTGVERITLSAAIGARAVDLAEVVSSYDVEIVSATAPLGVYPAVVDIEIQHKRPFDRRVVRAWSLDRPWEPSTRNEIPDGAGTSFSVRLPDGHLSGTYRLWMRVEAPWAAAPRLPRPDAPDVIDVEVEVGLGRDLAVPLDRLLVAINDPAPRFVNPDDVASHGDVLFALLAFHYRERGAAGLTGLVASKIINALDQRPEVIVVNLLRALDSGLVEPSESELLSIAVLPSVIRHERRINLELAQETREQIWQRFPILAAAIESWTDGDDACSRWHSALGWPVIEESGGDPDDVFFLPDQKLPPIPGFDGPVRLMAERPETRKALSEMWGSGYAPLSVTGRAEAVVDLLERWATERQVADDWYERNFTSIEASQQRLDDRLAGIVASYAVRGLDERSVGRAWLFSELSALALWLVSQDDPNLDIALALLTAMEFAPKWITHSILHGLSEVSDSSYQQRGLPR